MGGHLAAHFTSTQIFREPLFFWEGEDKEKRRKENFFEHFIDFLFSSRLGRRRRKEREEEGKKRKGEEEGVATKPLQAMQAGFFFSNICKGLLLLGYGIILNLIASRPKMHSPTKDFRVSKSSKQRIAKFDIERKRFCVALKMCNVRSGMTLVWKKTAGNLLIEPFDIFIGFNIRP